ncbi:MAG: DUF1289 domain-containing protein [Gammaproteobacteria bacterium]|jgi:predicted Fe-S protein YdhL (DUF1289 family)|nr:DUF1289 domain-containing protein [Gammaproteobacteria bacterium]MBK7169336.1 DUF1289 domain-containing protein [Gammaproteobacteria bacterium]MBK7522456.1 DUF1289 domain-containing protein [Gammaproteobacteria bacterium]MBK7727214.1 DUF1289 domain-containing protein [Gammaproteobacteria bacterium]
MSAVTPQASPCIRHCTLDEADICIGCGRSLQDILDWSAMDADAREQALERAAAWRAQARLRQPGRP